MEILDKLIYESTTKITKPIAQQLTNRLLIFIGLKNMLGDEIYFKDYTEASSNTRTPDHKPKINTNRCDVDISINYNPKDVKWGSFDFNHTGYEGLSRNTLRSQYPIFKDKKNNIYLSEYNIPCILKLDFDIKLANVELIDVAMSAIYHKFSTNSVFKYNALQFKYPLPDIMLLSLFRLFKLKDNVDEMTFEEYIKVGSDSQISLVVNRDNLEQKQLNILKTNVFVIGEVEYDYSPPDVEKKNQLSNRYGIKFSYTVEFAKPNMLRLSYPIVIDNKPIPKEYIIKDRDEVLQDLVGYTHKFVTFSNYYFDKDNLYEAMYGKYEAVKYPTYDRWLLPSNTKNALVKNYLTIFSGILEVYTDEIGNFLEINIEEDILPLLPEVTGNFIKNVLLYQGNNSKYDTSLLNISIFKDEYIVEDYKFEIRDNLILFIIDNISTSSIYRISFNVVHDLSYLSNEYILLALKYYDYMDYIIVKNADWLLANNYITVEERFKPEIVDGAIYIPQNNNINFTNEGEVNHGSNGKFRVGRFIIQPIKFIRD